MNRFPWNTTADRATLAARDDLEERLRESYRPYDAMPAFDEGMVAYENWQPCPYSADSVERQAWDRGAEFAMRLNRIDL